jgi:hypothetical protein
MAGSGRGDARAAATADLIGGCPTGQSRNQETRSKALLVVVVRGRPESDYDNDNDNENEKVCDGLFGACGVRG